MNFYLHSSKNFNDAKFNITDYNDFEYVNLKFLTFNDINEMQYYLFPDQ